MSRKRSVRGGSAASVVDRPLVGGEGRLATRTVWRSRAAGEFLSVGILLRPEHKSFFEGGRSSFLSMTEQVDTAAAWYRDSGAPGARGRTRTRHVVPGQPRRYV